MQLPLSVLVAALASVVNADVKVASPAAGVSFVAGGAIPITMADSGTAPAISLLSTYNIALMAGGNTAATMVQLAMLVPNGAFSAGLVAQGVVPAGLTNAANSANGYFLKIVSAATSGGQVVNYSNRFGMTGMTGTFDPAVLAAITALGTSNAGPPTEDGVTNAAAGAAAGAAGFGVPYSLQTGLTKYAPMQGIPPTKITAGNNPTPLYPTSAFTVATTYLPVPSQVTTTTEAQTFSANSHVNSAPAASQPVGGTDTAAQKFMERWKD
ncbi:hypothetical protein K461DRAFT_269185 [Myriangium duriaei CBS 260.36]|uniref:Uncharacterized protein n=1 Tax=Myriangium duriaei CBS 260.36 TaxID=1168546 RepID=A0A9P4J2B1_9PEZI|nr:hypothetical protein K461DRAFT_269185 [Myriangium duriaei CBS 260.36]